MIDDGIVERPLANVEVRAIATRILRQVRHTPVIDLGSNVVVKCESLQLSGSFKYRGALAAIEEMRSGGVVTGSSGNHGIALAQLAGERDIRLTVFVTPQAVRSKVYLLKNLGAEIKLIRGGNSERDEAAKRYARMHGLRYVSSVDDRRVAAGQGTLAFEVLEQVPTIRSIYVPVGGGGLLSGVCAALEGRPDVRVVGVEPAGASRFIDSIRSGSPVEISRVETICDGARAAKPGTLAWATMRRFQPEFMAVSDGAVMVASARLAAMGVCAEMTGALALAGCMQERGSSAGMAVVIVSGGNGVATT